MNKYLKDLIFSLRENKIQNIEENKAFSNFYKSIEKDEKFKKILDYSLLVSAINSLFIKYEKAFKKIIQDKDVINFENEIHNFLKLNHYNNGLILFTNRIHTNKKLKFGNYIIYGNLEKPFKIFSKFTFLRNNKENRKRLLQLIDHGEKTRNFRLEKTAITHSEINSITKYEKSSDLYIQYLMIVLKILTMDSYHKPKKFKTIKKSEEQYFPKHTLVLSEIFNNSHYEPIHTDLVADINLDQIGAGNLKIGKLILDILLKDHYNELDIRYYKCLFFFTKGLDQRYTSSIREGYALEILFYYISLEILILFGQKEKKHRIAVIVSNLIEKDESRKQKIMLTLKSLYDQRSDFVHEGKDFYNKFESSSFRNLSEEKVNDLRDIVGKLVITFPKLLNRIRKQKNARSEIFLWKEKVEKIWEKEKDI